MQIANLFRIHTITEIMGINTNVSAEMLRSIELWNGMLSGNAPWHDKAPPCGILEQIAGRLNTLVLREIGLDVENPAIAKAMKHINEHVDRIVEYIVLLGGCLVRPIFAGGRIQHEMLPLGNYLPTRYDFDGTLTGALLMKQIEIGAKKWLLTEEHTFENETHRVQCSLFRNDGGTLRRASLSDCPQTADLTESYFWQGVKMPMIVEFRNHATNKIDGSNVPVPVIAGAEGLIKDADEQYARMLWEQEAGEMRVFADRDMFRKRQMRDGTTTKAVMTPQLSRLLVQIEGDGSADGKKITEHAPALRTAQQVEALQQIFRRIELTCNIGKGTISDMESTIQTATQYSGGRSELFAIVDKIEDEIEAKYRQCAEVFAYMAAAYNLGENNPKITVTWNDDTTRKDMTAAKQMAMQEIAAGVRDKWEYRRDFYGEDEATAKQRTPETAAAANPFFAG